MSGISVSNTNMARISIKNIAQALGISNATVSLVLNGKEKEGRVGKETADLIRKTAKDMNYEPNTLARSLRMGKSQTIGLIVADISNLFFANLAFHIQEHAEKFNYSVIITNTSESESKMEKMIQVLKGRQVDGLIIVPTEHGEKSIEKLTKSTIPVVLLDRYFPGMNVSHVVVNNYQASIKATEHLINKKCKKIGIIIYDNILPHMQERKRGYTDAMQKAGLFDPSLIKEISYTNISSDIEKSLKDLLSNDCNIDGIFFATNSIALHGIKNMLLMDAEIMKKINVICFDKSEALDFSSTAIPYIQQPIAEMGKTAIDLLISQINDKTSVPLHVELLASLQNEIL